MLFIDFKKAYNCIHSESSVCTLEQFGLSLKIVSLIKASIMKTEIKVQVRNSSSTTVQVTTRLRQGDALSQILFNT